MVARNPTLAEPFRSILNAATPDVKPVPMWRGVKIHAHFVYPPIPTRKFDWCASTDNYDGTDGGNEPLGWGATEQEAINDLIEQLEDEAE